jgi:hypothetical protein
LKIRIKVAIGKPKWARTARRQLFRDVNSGAQPFSGSNQTPALTVVACHAIDFDSF